MKRKLVNWSGTMYMSPNLLRQLEDYFFELQSESTALGLNNFRYGLLPLNEETSSEHGIVIQEKITGSIEIRLFRCRAITQGGYLIDYPFESTDCMVKNFTFSEKAGNNDQTWDVILSISPYARTLSGIPAEDEDPPRHPDAVPTVDFSILSASQINEGKLNPQQLVIGKIRKKGERYEIDTNYIPPCTCMAAHPQLMIHYNQLATMMSSLENASRDIARKIKDKEKASSLAGNIERLCLEIMRHISTTYFSFRNIGGNWSPYETVNCFSNLAHVFYVGLSFLSVQEREELFNYFYEWQMLVPGKFEASLSQLIEMRYNHNDIYTMIGTVMEFMTALTDLWIKLSELEYIGLHKRSVIVSEGLIEEENKRNKFLKGLFS